MGIYIQDAFKYLETVIVVGIDFWKKAIISKVYHLTNKLNSYSQREEM